MSTWEEKVPIILDALKDEAKDLWDEFRAEEEEFLKSTARDIARELHAAATAATEAERQVHAENLRFLKVTVQARLVQTSLKLGRRGKEILPRIVAMAARVLLGAKIFGG